MGAGPPRSRTAVCCTWQADGGGRQTPPAAAIRRRCARHAQELHPTPESLQRAAAKRASVLEAIGRSLDNPDSVALRDKFIFLLGIFNLACALPPPSLGRG